MTGRRPDPLGTFAKATTPHPAAVERVLDGVLPHIDPQPVVQLLPRQAPRGRRSPWLAVAITAAAVIVAVTSGWLALRGPTFPTELVSRVPVHAMLAPGVHASYQGHGRVDVASPVLVHLNHGWIQLSVQADAKRPVSVQTEEAMVQVVGTLFTVTRDSMGTRVEVSHGTVIVTCSGQEPIALTAGGTRMCHPVAGASMLGRLNNLRDQGQPAERLLEEIEEALEVSDETLSHELEARRIQIFLDEGRNEEAAAAIDRTLERTKLRRGQLLRIRAGLARTCAERLRYLGQIPPEERLPADGEMEAGCR